MLVTHQALPRLGIRRVASRLVDAFTVFFLTFGIAVTVLFPVMAPLTDALDRGPWGTRLAPTLLFVAVAVAYETAFVSLRGQTPGRDLLGVRVVAVESGGPPPRRVAAVRSLVWLVVLLPSWGFVAVAGALTVVWVVCDPSGRTPVDRAVGTEVVRYDADVEEGPLPARAAGVVDGRYGPRSWRSLVGMPKP